MPGHRSRHSSEHSSLLVKTELTTADFVGCGLSSTQSETASHMAHSDVQRGLSSQDLECRNLKGQSLKGRDLKRPNHSGASSEPCQSGVPLRILRRPDSGLPTLMP